MQTSSQIHQLMQKQMYDLVYNFANIELHDYVSNRRLIMIEFEQFGFSNSNMSYGYIIIHLMDLESMEIVSYKKQIQTISTIIQNYCYCNDVKLVECRGDKCRNFDHESLCTSCYDPDYLNYYELLNFIEYAKKFNEILFIYTNEDYEILNEIMDYFTNTYVTHGINTESPSLVDVGYNKKMDLIDNMYSAFLKGYGPLSNYRNNLYTGPDASKLPFPTQLFKN